MIRAGRPVTSRARLTAVTRQLTSLSAPHEGGRGGLLFDLEQVITALTGGRIRSLRRIPGSPRDLYNRRRATEYLALRPCCGSFDQAVKLAGKARGDVRIDGLAYWYRSTVESLAHRLEDQRTPPPRYGRRHTVYPCIRHGRAVITRAKILAVADAVPPLSPPVRGRQTLFDQAQVVAALHGEPLPPLDTATVLPDDLLTAQEIAAEIGVRTPTARAWLTRLRDPSAQPVVVEGVEHFRRHVLASLTSRTGMSLP